MYYMTSCKRGVGMAKLGYGKVSERETVAASHAAACLLGYLYLKEQEF